jgi:hypothetical protein
VNIGQLRNAVAQTVSPQLSLQSWLRRADQIDSGVSDAIEGIYCGTAGTCREVLTTFPGHFLVFGWCYGTIEYAYVS